MTSRLVAFVAAATLALSAPSVLHAEGAPADDLTRMTFAQSVDVRGAGSRIAAIRAQHGLSRPLSHSARLQAAAQVHADEMARTGRFSHTGANGSTLRTRVRAAGYNACFMAENIAYGQPGVSRVLSDWMASPGHRRNMLATQATQFGLAQTGSYFVLVLGRNC